MSAAGEVVIAYGELLTLHDRLRASGEESAANHVHTASEWLERALRACGAGSGAWIGSPKDAEPV